LRRVLGDVTNPVELVLSVPKDKSRIEELSINNRCLKELGSKRCRFFFVLSSERINEKKGAIRGEQAEILVWSEGQGCPFKFLFCGL